MLVSLSFDSTNSENFNQSVDAGFLNSIGGRGSRFILKLMHLWSEVKIMSVTVQSGIKGEISLEHTEMSNTSFLVLVIKVGLLPIFNIKRSVDIIKSSNVVPL